MSDYLNNLNSIYTSGLNNTQNTSSIENTLKNTDLSSASDDELMSVCKSFESYFTEQIMKSMVKMSKVDGNSDSSNIYSSLFGISEDNSDSAMSTLAGYYGDEMIQKAASMVSDSNNGEGLGIAQKLYEQMKRNYGG